MHVDDLFETDRIPVIALGIDSRPADRLSLDLANYAQPDTAQKRMLGLFHVQEKIREMDDAGSVRVTKFYAATGGESVQVRIWSLG